MNIRKKQRIGRLNSIVLLVVMVLDLFRPTATFALTSGPTQPEFSSFEPVSTSNMVNTFTGDFTYNLPVIEIPGANGGGYAMSLSYHGGSSVEDESSWVGNGWTLNPGAITRNKRGFADDVKKSEVTYWNKIPKNWTVSVGEYAGVEAMSFGLSGRAAVSYNNYKGYGQSFGLGLTALNGVVSLGLGWDDGEQNYSVSVNPAKAASGIMNAEADGTNNAGLKQAAGTVAAIKGGNFLLAKGGRGSNYGIFTYGNAARASNVSEFSGWSLTGSFGVNIDPSFLHIGLSAGLLGTYTEQNAVAQSTLNAYGYMYSGNSVDPDHDVMDYTVEKNNMYQKSKFLGIPLNSADNFLLSGEGLGGGFRLFNKTLGSFHPTHKHNPTMLYNFGAEGNIGAHNGVGVSAGGGKQDVWISDWYTGSTANSPGVNSTFATAVNDDGTPNFVTNTDEPYFFRFNNDMGGKALYSTNDAPLVASLTSGIGSAIATKEVLATINAGDYKDLTDDNGLRTGRSSYIAFHTNGEMLETDNNGVFYNRYERDVTNKVTNRAEHFDGVGEVVTFNESGNRYVYGLPVYSGKEKNMSFGITGNAKLKKNHLVYENISDNNNNDSPLSDIVVGEERADEYANSWLLTEISSPDYFDKTLNGPSDDDFGAWTKFKYKRETNYHWRAPYTGLLYNRGQFSNKEDDRGGMESGQKEIYFLDTIFTKTHYAVFVKSDRLDGRGSVIDGLADNDENAIGNDKLQKLDRIELWAKNKDSQDPSKQDILIKTVRFQYDYSLCPGTPNSTSPEKGKLTLKKVWFEYGGVIPVKISPYKFAYEYPQVNYPAPYGTSIPSNPGNFSAANQNPAYDMHNFDAWGSFQVNGQNRFNNFRPWLDQNVKPTAGFDPAAWQLKKITLPSGGEIHVQYEQKDYQYVQDKPVMAMVSLQPLSNQVTQGSPENRVNQFKLNCADIGIADGLIPNTGIIADKDKKDSLVAEMNHQFVYNGERIYFKLFYRLIGKPKNNLSAASSECEGEFIRGYATVSTVTVDPVGDIIITLNEGTGIDLPNTICENFVTREKSGLISEGKCKIPETVNVQTDKDESGAESQIKAFIENPGFSTDLCKEFSPTDSYFKIPLIKPKKAGGVRVKRLLIYDSGIASESGDEQLYGTEYIYQDGVATNEPQTIREENALVGFISRYENSYTNKIVAGQQLDATEGPLGENLLPGASIGYAKVITKGIHSGKTNTGFTVYEFNTAKDFPFSVKTEFTDLEDPKHKVEDFLPLPLGIINVNINNLWLSQGFKFEINSMHGQPKTVKSYGGDYTNMDKAILSASKEIDYFKPGDQISMMYGIDKFVGEDLPGKEMDITIETKTVNDVTDVANLEGDIGIGLLPAPTPSGFLPIPGLSVGGGNDYNESRLSTHSTSKVIRYPAIVKKITTIANQMEQSTENIAFNPETGQPVITRTYDGFKGLKTLQKNDPVNYPSTHNGTYLSTVIPASQHYTDMGQKAFNEKAYLKSEGGQGNTYNKVMKGGSLHLEFLKNGIANCACKSQLVAGDLIALFQTVINPSDLQHPNKILDGLYHAGDVDQYGLKIYPTSQYANTNTALASIDIEVIRSGKTNELTAGVGSITTFGVDHFEIIGANNNALTTDRTNRVNLAKALTIAIQSMIMSAAGTVSSVNALTYDPHVKLRPTGNTCTIPSSPGVDDKLVLTKIDANHVSFSQYWGLGNSFNCVFAQGAHFEVDDLGQIVLFASQGSCDPQPTKRLFCYDDLGDPLPPSIKNTIAATAQTLSDDWYYDATVFTQFPNEASIDPYELGTKGKWRTASTYAYKTAIIPGNASVTNPNATIYNNAGVFDKFNLFDWKKPQVNDYSKWILANTVTKYSPYGESIEERDVLNIPTAAKYGYKNMLPSLVAKNATQDNVQFYDFENYYYYIINFQQFWGLDDGVKVYLFTLDHTQAHSGKTSFSLSKLYPFTFKPIIKNVGDVTRSVIKFWVKGSNYTLVGQTHPSLFVQYNDYSLNNGNPPVMGTDLLYKVAQTGEWSLYETRSAVSTSGVSKYIPMITTAIANTTITVDDVRLQPQNSSMTAYVYDQASLRLLASFDDQHFGMYYQYNSENKLIRTLIETASGKKVITEKHTNIPSIPRSQ